MVAARAHYYQRIALGCEVEVHVLHLGIGLAEVDGNESAQRAGRLIHKAGGLAEVHVLGILRDLSHFKASELAVVVQAAEYIGHQHLERRRGGQTRALEHAGGDYGVKAAHLVAQLGKARRHAADKRHGGFLFALHLVQRRGIHYQRAVIALGVHGDYAVVGGRGNRNGVQIYARGQHAARLMVGMVAADFGASGRGEEAHALNRTELLEKALGYATVAFHLVQQYALALAVQFGELVRGLGRPQEPENIGQIIHNNHTLPSVMYEMQYTQLRFQGIMRRRPALCGSRRTYL